MLKLMLARRRPAHTRSNSHTTSGTHLPLQESRDNEEPGPCAQHVRMDNDAESLQTPLLPGDDGTACQACKLMGSGPAQKGAAHLRPDRLGNVAEGVDGRAPDALLVRLEHLQQLEADAHPLARGHELCAAVRDAPHQVDAVLLHLRLCVTHGRKPVSGHQGD